MLPTMRNRNTMGTLFDVSREVDRLMNTVWAESADRGVQFVMPAEVLETGEELRFHIEMPGFRQEDIELTLENNLLTVTGEKKFEQSQGRSESDYRLFERRYGRYQRSFTVPPTVRADRCEASYENGVLTIRLPKAEEARPRRIQIGGDPGRRSIGEAGQNGEQRS